MNKELKEKIQNFIQADYPRVGEHISLIECLKTITKKPDFELEDESRNTTFPNASFTSLFTFSNNTLDFPFPFFPTTIRTIMTAPPSLIFEKISYVK